MNIVAARWGRSAFVALLSLASLQSTSAQELAVSGWTQPAMAGADVRFRLSTLNTNSAPVAWKFPCEIECRLTASQGEREAVAKLTAGGTGRKTFPPAASRRPNIRSACRRHSRATW